MSELSKSFWRTLEAAMEKRELYDHIEPLVERGAKLLDETDPGWHDEIELGELDMESCGYCILGQLNGNYQDVLHNWFDRDCAHPRDQKWAANRGFLHDRDYIDEHSEPGEEWPLSSLYYNVLGNLWTREVRERRKD